MVRFCVYRYALASKPEARVVMVRFCANRYALASKPEARAEGSRDFSLSKPHSLGTRRELPEFCSAQRTIHPPPRKPQVLNVRPPAFPQLALRASRHGMYFRLLRTSRHGMYFRLLRTSGHGVHFRLLWGSKNGVYFRLLLVSWPVVFFQLLRSPKRKLREAAMFCFRHRIPTARGLGLPAFGSAQRTIRRANCRIKRPLQLPSTASSQ
jgi:hypothetical protein